MLSYFVTTFILFFAQSNTIKIKYVNITFAISCMEFFHSTYEHKNQFIIKVYKKQTMTVIFNIGIHWFIHYGKELKRWYSLGFLKLFDHKLYEHFKIYCGYGITYPFQE